MTNSEYERANVYYSQGLFFLNLWQKKNGKHIGGIKKNVTLQTNGNLKKLEDSIWK